MGGENKQTQTQESSVKPLEFTIPGLENMTGQIEGLLGQTGITDTQKNALSNITNTVNGLQPQLTGILQNFLGGGGVGSANQNIQNSLGVLQNQLTPIAQGQNLNVEQNPYLQKIVQQGQDSIRNQIGSAFAGAGRSFSGAHMNALGNALGDSSNRMYFDAYNNERNNQMNAINGLLSGSLAGAGALDQSALAKAGLQTQGSQLLPIASAGDYATLDQEASRMGIPAQNLGTLANLLVPIASLGKDVNSTGTTVQKTDPFQTIVGGLLGAAGTAAKAGLF